MEEAYLPPALFAQGLAADAFYAGAFVTEQDKQNAR
tara:strand:- start:895 stop:1002 length:108 start_codon:yes stop_codon:yes gene_type:complete